VALKDFVTKGTWSEPEPIAPPAAPPAPPVQAQPPAPAPERRSPPAALLDASVEFTGTMRCRESIRIDARCEGELHCERTVIIGEPAVLRMAITADSVVVAGQVHGDITARRKITLEPTARVTGNLRTPGIVIQEGAQLEGRIMIGDEVPGARTAHTERAPGQELERAAGERPAPATVASAAPAAASEPGAPGAPRPRKPTPTAPPPVS
jgi:cytoskeletal protein CcmA (bactofilin family)